MNQNAMTTIITFLSEHLNDFLAIAGVYALGQFILYFLARRLADKAGENHPGGRRHKQARTVGKLVHDSGHTMLLIIILFWILRLLGVDPTPILASASIVGLAIGFGAQALVKDFISGLFIIAENQYGLGDRVQINGQEGIVYRLTMRSTVLTNDEGSTIFIPNGTITTVVTLAHEKKVDPS